MLKSIILNAEIQSMNQGTGYLVLKFDCIAERNAPYFKKFLQATQISACMAVYLPT